MLYFIVFLGLIICITIIALAKFNQYERLLIDKKYKKATLKRIYRKERKKSIRIRKTKKRIMKIKQWVFLLMDLVCSWILIPISMIVPVKKDLVLFMGRKFSGFLDNNKYLLMYLKQTGETDKYDIRFVGHKDRSVKRLKELGFSAENFFSLKVYWLIMRANVIVTDNAHWTTHNRYNIARKAHKVQMWHGIGFKKIRLSDPDFVQKSQGIKGFLRYKLQGQLATYDTFISTSKFFSEEVFVPSFEPREIVNLGYCRNDVLFDEFKFDDELIKINTDVKAWERINELKNQGKKIVIYSPTFRNAKVYSVRKDEVDFDLLDKFAGENNIIIVFKLHPLPRNTVKMSGYQNIIEYNSKCDVYPLFSISDMMITDYSSIYLDYILLDKPISFFMYDFDHYTQDCRGIRDDFADMLPGAKCLNQAEIMGSMYKTLVLGMDEYQEKRKFIRDFSWEHQDGHSCKRVWEYIKGKYLLDNKEDR